MNIINVKTNSKFLEEYILICLKEWGNYSKYSNNINLLTKHLNNKKNKILSENSNEIAILGLVDTEILIGFISIFKSDHSELTYLSPWYSTMYIKKEFRNNGYSKLLHKAIINEAKSLGYSKLYLKTNLCGYYETEKLYSIDF